MPIEKAKEMFEFPEDQQVLAGVFIVEQANGKMRPCVNYAPLNSVTQRNYYPMPLVENLLADVGGSVLFTQLDMPDAYHLIRIVDKDVWKTAFVCHRGVFVYLVMPFGLTNCPPEFQSFMTTILFDCLGFTHIYIDNMMIATKSKSGVVTPEVFQQHLNEVRAVLKKLKENNLFLRPEKCSFAVTRIDFLGFIIDKDGLHMNPTKVDAILKWEPPTKKNEIQRFMGFSNFYRRFVPEFSQISRPLNALTKKGAKFDGKPITGEPLKAFRKLQDEFAKGRMLITFNPKRVTYVKIDGCDVSLGGTLKQVYEEDGQEFIRAVAFHSRTFSTSELNYDVHDKELLAIVDCFRVWRGMLLTCEQCIIVQSDHQNLSYFQSKQKLNQRQFRWAIFLADFNFKITFTS